MTDYLKRILNAFFLKKTKETSFEDEVKYSVKKYYNTYRSLEEYDKKPKKDSAVLVDREGVRDYFRALHR